MAKQYPAYTLEINNFSQRNAPIRSKLFTIHNCNWYVTVYPKGNGIDTHMSLYLEVADPLSLSQGWSSRETKFRFVIVNESNSFSSKNLETYYFFNPTTPNRGFKKAIRLTKLQKKKFMANDKLKIRVYITVTSRFGPLDSPVFPEKKEYQYVYGFEVLTSQVTSVRWILETYPETALYVQPQDPELKKAYMSVLLRIYDKLYNSRLGKLTEAELNNVSKSLLDLTQAGFKLEWLRAKLNNVYSERKKLRGYETQVEELGKQLKSLELQMCNLKAEIKLKAES